MSYTIKFKNGCINEFKALHHENLSYADLRCINLQGVDLSCTNLSHADLRDADLRDTDLHDADLHGADLRDADLCGANLYAADLRGTNLHGAYLHAADLSVADLRGANLQGASIDFSVWPLWCGSIGVKTDKRIAAQLLYHALDAMANCTDACVRDMVLRHADLLEFANSFHRVVDGDCAYICAKTKKED